MSQENVELVKRSVEDFNRGDLDALFPDADPEFEWHDQPELPGSTIHYGTEAAVEPPTGPTPFSAPTSSTAS